MSFSSTIFFGKPHWFRFSSGPTTITSGPDGWRAPCRRVWRNGPACPRRLAELSGQLSVPRSRPPARPMSNSVSTASWGMRSPLRTMTLGARSSISFFTGCRDHYAAIQIVEVGTWRETAAVRVAQRAQLRRNRNHVAESSTPLVRSLAKGSSILPDAWRTGSAFPATFDLPLFAKFVAELFDFDAAETPSNRFRAPSPRTGPGYSSGVARSFASRKHARSLEDGDFAGMSTTVPTLQK